MPPSRGRPTATPDAPALTFVPTGDPADGETRYDYATLLPAHHAGGQRLHRPGRGARRCRLVPAAEPARDALHALGRGGGGHREPGESLPRSRPHGRHPERRGHGGARGAGAAGAAGHLGKGRGPARARADAARRRARRRPRPVPALGAGLRRAAGRSNRATRWSAPRRPQGEDVASYFHTGGTTGTPKLARRTHFNEAANAWALATAARHRAAGHAALRPAAVPFERDADHRAGALQRRRARGAAVAARAIAIRAPSAAFWRSVERYRATFVQRGADGAVGAARTCRATASTSARCASRSAARRRCRSSCSSASSRPPASSCSKATA